MAKEGSCVAKVRAVLVATLDLIKLRRERGSDFMESGGRNEGKVFLGVLNADDGRHSVVAP